MKFFPSIVDPADPPPRRCGDGGSDAISHRPATCLASSGFVDVIGNPWSLAVATDRTMKSAGSGEPAAGIGRKHLGEKASFISPGGSTFKAHENHIRERPGGSESRLFTSRRR